MDGRTLRARLVAGAAAGLVVGLSSPAAAQTAAELQARLEAMQRQMEAMQRKLAEIQSDRMKADQKEPAPGVKLDPKKLQIESADGRHRIRVGGRIMVDGLVADEDGADAARLGDGSEIRRARIFIEGEAYEDWEYKSQWDFAPGDGVEAKDVYLRYAGFERTDVTLGHFKEPFSLEELTSSKYITFMERPMAVETFAPSRSLGVGVATRGAAMQGGWTGAVGFFGEGFDDAGSNDEGYGVAGRVTFAPLATKTRVVHLGGSVELREPGDDGGVRFRARPEVHATSTRLVDTGSIGDVEDTTKWGVEAAAVWGPTSLQGEFIQTMVDSSAAGDPDLSGWYVHGSWFPTGESRAYRAKSGAFGRVKPKQPFRLSGGWGAWELGVRFSHIDLSDGAVSGGEEDNLTLGVSWYVNPLIRLMANYVKVLELEDTGDPDLDGSEPGGFQLRAQIDF